VGPGATLILVGALGCTHQPHEQLLVPRKQVQLQILDVNGSDTRLNEWPYAYPSSPPPTVLAASVPPV
jgi:hypothetical protein